MVLFVAGRVEHLAPWCFKPAFWLHCLYWIGSVVFFFRYPGIEKVLLDCTSCFYCVVEQVEVVC